MSRVGLICFTCLVALHADAQAVVTASGGQGIGPDLHVAWTMGELIIVTGTSANTVATQGFHQPPADFTTAIVPINVNSDWQLFPNPTRSLLRLNTSSSEAHHADVLNALGQRVARWSIHASSTAWSVEGLASGTYRMRVYDRSENELSTLPFIVTQ